MRNLLLVILMIAGALLATACGGEPTDGAPDGRPSTDESQGPYESPLDMPNPASKHCRDQGYQLELRTDADGTTGYCVFPDGSECEEWAFYRGECGPADDTFTSPVELANPASTHCETQGYTLEMRTDDDGGTVGYCIFPDGTECEEWAYYRGECEPRTP